MNIGTIREVKGHEYRVGLTPCCVKEYREHGHEVAVESGAGAGAGFSDAEYAAAGARIVENREEVFDSADMVVKVKEPLPQEYDLIREGQILFTYLHLAPAPDLARALLARNARAVAYETIELADRKLPCLKPMSEIAGRLSVQEGAKYLEKPFGGRGVLLGGVPGVRRGRVVILGAGTVGTNACKMAVGIGADVTVLDVNADRLEYLDDIFGARINTLYSTPGNIESAVADADLVIGAVLIPGASAPKLIRREHLRRMRPGSVIVDVAVDQGGCIETTRPTTHENPVFVEEGVVHYCVANMPGAVPETSTVALTSTTLKYGLLIADQGLEKASQLSPPLARGVNLYGGHCVHPSVAQSLGMAYTSLESLLS
ncbi:MAG: alanine dehydrogenase [Lentisphaerae bacterium RIFOXYB12_FULL_65_16]|nr:MAG: alanine dehydrogenase [Lentisphaerae bacterium RIFOXYA12_64_32]OGV88688.1 MAG: alanine dehydrogenase [Lentisphaerae bacterium RIFOXYB12_FULL_65_16]